MENYFIDNLCVVKTKPHEVEKNFIGTNLCTAL